MTQALILGCVGLLVAFALVRGYTTKVLSQLRQEYGSLVTQVHQLQADRDQAQIIHESAVTQRNQAEGACKDFRNELESLAQEIAQTEEELGRSARLDGSEGGEAEAEAGAPESEDASGAAASPGDPDPGEDDESTA